MTQTLLGIVWTLVILTAIVLVHEAAHAAAARACGMRVSELFVGLPFGPRVSRRSRRSGIRYGATLALLGGYTRIDGMAYERDERLSLALAVVSARGRVSAEELALALGCDADEALELLGALADLGSVEVPEGAASPAVEDANAVWTTPRRDARGLTVADRGHDFAADGGAAAGQPYLPPEGADAFLASEVGRTYAGKGFPSRALVLLAGVASNLVCAVLLVTLYLCCHGVAVFDPHVALVSDGMPAQQAGMQAGDVIVSVDGQPVGQGQSDVLSALSGLSDGHEAAVVVERDGAEVALSMGVDGDGRLGVAYGTRLVTEGVADALYDSVSYALQTGVAIASLLVPAHTAEVVSQSSGIVGIVAVTGQAAQEGGWALVLLAASLSLSLAWLNLIPLPPLDGGKFVIELVSAVIRRPVSQRLQGALSLVGMALLTLLFVVMLGQDVSRIASGGM